VSGLPAFSAIANVTAIITSSPAAVQTSVMTNGSGLIASAPA